MILLLQSVTLCQPLRFVRFITIFVADHRRNLDNNMGGGTKSTMGIRNFKL